MHSFGDFFANLPSLLSDMAILLVEKYKKRICKSLLTLLLLLLPILLLSAPNAIDNLLDSYNKNGNRALAQEFFKTLQAEGVTDELVLIASDASAEYIDMLVWYWAAEYYYSKQNYELCCDYGEKALPLCDKFSDKEMKADCLNLMAIVNIRRAKYGAAADYAEQCYKLDLESGDNDRISSSLNTLAGIHLTAKRPNDAERYIQKALEYNYKTNNLHRRSVLLGMASEIYYAKGDYSTSLENAKKAYDIELSLKREMQANLRLSQMGNALLGLKEYEEAEATFEKVILFFESSGNKQSLGISNNKMGTLNLAQNRPEKAIPYFKRAASIFVELGDSFNELYSRKGLYEAYWSVNLDSAKVYYEAYDRLKDSLYNNEVAESIGRHDASIGNAELRILNSRIVQNNKVLIRYGILAIILVGGIIWYVKHWHTSRQKARMRRAIEALKADYEQIYGKYQEILDKAQQPQDTVEASESVATSDKGASDFLNKIIAIVIDHGEDPAASFSVEDIASKMCVSSGHLNRKVKFLTGMTTQNYVLRLRLEKARLMLQSEPDALVADVAFRCGFEDAASFSRAFKKIYNQTPTQVRAN